MTYAKIVITVKYDNTLFTDEQREQAEIADGDIDQAHPLDKGLDGIDDVLNATMAGCFSYLGEGRKAVSVSWDTQ